MKDRVHAVKYIRMILFLAILENTPATLMCMGASCKMGPGSRTFLTPPTKNGLGLAKAAQRRGLLKLLEELI